jgi:hypothetical protein
MKKLLIAVGSLLVSSIGFTEGLEDQFKLALLDHVDTVVQFRDNDTNIALMDSILMMGHRDGRSILDLQAGFGGETKPEPGEVNQANFLYGAMFNISSLIKDKIPFASDWKFLNSLEYGVAYTHDSRENNDYWSLQAGLTFTLNPNQ